jgi:isopropylmalate/homocitrate/citramalate synthase
MSDLPASVEFHEEGPREGFQMEPQTYALADRAALIDALAASGLKQIQVASFVSPRAVPLAAVTDHICWLVDACADRRVPLPAVYLADTMGWANPEEIKRRVGAVREIVPQAQIGLHLHDTRGVGGANVHAALQMGVRRFDSSVAGLGGCPFAGHTHGGAAGNICTEDMVFMCQELGIETGIDLELLIEAARLAERIIGRTLPGRVMHSGSLKAFRSGAAKQEVCGASP